MFDIVLFSQTDLKKLAGADIEHALTLSLPVDPTGEGRKAARIHLKNGAAQTRRQLESRGEDTAAWRDEFEAIEALQEDDAFWDRTSGGLAVFAAPGFLRRYVLPVPFEPQAHVGSVFDIKALLGAVGTGTEFYILAISQAGVRLFRGSRFTVVELELPDAPRGVDDLFLQDDTSPQLQFRTLGGGGASHAAIIHGQGSTARAEDAHVLHYFRLVDEDVRKIVDGTGAPLIFAGDAPLFPLYEHANSYKNLAEDFVAGNPDHLDAEQLHEKAWSIVHQQLERARDAFVGRIEEGIAKERGSNKVATIVHKSTSGLAGSLALRHGARVWGEFDVESGAGQVHVHPERMTRSEDLLNLAAVHTIRHGGDVAVVPERALPTDVAAAAQFRH